uniref:Protein disulfide-isomerase n=1 Tax=Rhizophora mucronata TaxID=61149 RepID=A0A2P2JIW1_RHIMU
MLPSFSQNFESRESLNLIFMGKLFISFITSINFSQDNWGVMTAQNRCSFLILWSKPLAVATPMGVEFDHDEIVPADRAGEIGVIQGQHVLL